jgi:uncharacterized membrane protein YfcA
MPELEWLWLLLMGFGTGAYGILVGAGGGFILGPLLLIFFDMEPSKVAGTVLALVAANGISGMLAFRRMGTVDQRSGILFSLAGIPGAVIAPFALTAVAPGLFRLLFGLTLVVLALRVITQKRELEVSQQPREIKSSTSSMIKTRIITSETGRVFQYQFNEALATFVNFLLGFISSFFGTGGGFLRTPILVYGFGFPVQIAVATSIYSLAFVTSAGTITHIALGHVEWFPTFVFASIGLILGGNLGARLTNKIKGPWIMRLLLVVVFALGLNLLIEGIRSL